jgi:hypothetical protein
MESAISSFGLACDGVFEDPLDAGLGQRLQAVQRQAQAHARDRRPGPAIPRRSRTDPAGGRHLRQRLQQQGRLADAGIAADQHHRALGQPPPSTRSNSPMPVDTRACSVCRTSANATTCGTSTLPAQPLRREAGDAACAALSSTISLSVFHAPQASHWPCHLAWSAPHSVHT